MVSKEISTIFIIFKVLGVIFLLLSVACTNNVVLEEPRSGISQEIEKGIPSGFDNFIAEINYDSLGADEPEFSYMQLSDNLAKITLTWRLSDTLHVDDWQLNIHPDFTPDFHWSPHLTPMDEHIIGQHVFRAPALIVASEPEQKQLTIIPDLDLLQNENSVPWYMDMNAPDNKLTLGAADQRVKEHVLFKRAEKTVFPPGEFKFGFYVMTNSDDSALSNPFRKPLEFMWNRWGGPGYDEGEPMEGDLEPYVEHTYNWAFNSWEENVWQEFELEGQKVGAPAFIINVTQSPNYPGEVDEREFRSIWNQTWFSSLRSAQGVFRYARRTGDEELMERAKLTKELALSFPQKEGFFPGLIATEMKEIEIDGETYIRSKGWNTYYFGNSNRNPYTRDPREAPYHIVDMSWTAYQMLRWYDELEKDERLLKYATRFANSLIELQDEEGFFPGWLSKENLEPMEHLNRSPETAMSVTFLLKMHELTGDKSYYDSAIRAMEAVTDEIIPKGRWEDYETYWSCNRYGTEDLINKKVERNNMYKQNNLSMYWTAKALLESYLLTGEEKYLDYGRRTLDELLMTQATWQPPYMYVNTLGGFGVMNADGEWNDSRQSLFAELIIRYGEQLDSEEYIQRGLAALRASFVMMYAPENPKTKEQWEKKWDFFGKEDYGFMMENYGHGGTTDPGGVGIGSFTIYDWGNGAASEAYNRIVDHYGMDFISRK